MCTEKSKLMKLWQEKLDHYLALLRRVSVIPKTRIAEFEVELKKAREESNAALDALRQHARKHGCL